MTDPRGGSMGSGALGPDIGYSGGSEPSDVAGARGVAATGDLRRLSHTSPISRAKMARELRRTQQFAKFRLTELNLVPLVDTFVSIVFFALTTATVGELAPVVKGINLPQSRVGSPALQQITLGIGPQVSLAGRPLMTTQQAATATSNIPNQPLVIPQLYTALKSMADSIRQARRTPRDQQVEVPIAIQGDRTMRYDLLSRVIMSARLAGFKTISLQVNRTGVQQRGTPPAGGAAPAPAAASTGGVPAAALRTTATARDN